MQLQVVPVTRFQQNCSVIWCGRTRAAAIVDPGGDLDRVLDVVAANKLELQKILLTHAHIDHAGATGELVRHGPGHPPGHVIFFNEPARFAIVGDVLFHGSIGRSDFPGGDHDTLIRSIRENLFPLGDDVRFLPGHGPMSTFGAERRTNPFVADSLFARASGAAERGA